MSSKENMTSLLVCGLYFLTELMQRLSSRTRNWTSAKSNAKVHQLMTVVSWFIRQVSTFWPLAFWSVSLRIYITLKSLFLQCWQNDDTREGQMEWVTHSGVFPPAPISRVQMGMVTWESGALRGACDGWSLLTATVWGGKPANPVWFMIWTRKRDGASEQTLQAVSRSLGVISSSSGERDYSSVTLLSDRAQRG